MSVTVTGFERVELNINKVVSQMDPAVVEPILLDKAVYVRNLAISNAPLGPTGNLKRGIVAKILTRRTENKYAPALVAIDYRIAPHAHLVEFGHVIRRQRRGPGYGAVPPHPFFRPAWDASKEYVRTAIEDEIRDNIEGAPT